MGYGRLEAELEHIFKEVAVATKRSSGVFVVTEDLDKLWSQART